METRDIETDSESASDSEPERLEERGAGCLLGRVLMVREQPEELKEALRLFPSRPILEWVSRKWV